MFLFVISSISDSNPNFPVQKIGKSVPFSPCVTGPSSSWVDNYCLSGGALMILSSLLYSSQKENRALNQWQVEWNSFVKYILTQFWDPGELNLSLLFNLISEPIIAHSVRPHEIVGEDSAL